MLRILCMKCHMSFVNVQLIPASYGNYKRNPQGLFCVFFRILLPVGSDTKTSLPDINNNVFT